MDIIVEGNTSTEFNDRTTATDTNEKPSTAKDVKQTTEELSNADKKIAKGTMITLGSFLGMFNPK